MNPSEVREALRLTGRTQTALAEELGITRQAVAAILRGDREIWIDEKPKIKRFFGPGYRFSDDKQAYELLPELLADGVTEPMWAVPVDWARETLNTEASNLRVLKVIGDGMVSDPPKPSDLLPGEKVFLNAGDRMPSPPGLFVINCSHNLYVARLMYELNGDVRVSWNNPAYNDWCTRIGDAGCQEILGRVVARMQLL